MDILIIGSGLAGCQTAYQLLKIHPQAKVTIVCKGSRRNCNSYLAQGGIAVANDPEDSWQQHYQDTLQAGVQHNHPSHTRLMVAEGPAILQELMADGLSFDRQADGRFQYGLEGAHSVPRILHCQGDQTGKYMTDFFQKKLRQVQWLEQAQVSELLTIDDRCCGIRYLDQQDRPKELAADAVVLATGGFGGLYPLTTNDETITGDGAAMILRLGLPLQDMEFMQFHPTLLTIGGHCFGLISEAVRGAGARLVNETGRAIMEQHHPLKDLAPRDVVARILTEEYENGHEVFLDISAIDDFTTHFPQISSNLQKHGIPYETTGLIPVRPGAHFAMGGIPVDRHGQTALKNLYAVGEAAWTGVHGANRLASNSLLECLVFGKRVATAISRQESALVSTVNGTGAAKGVSFALPLKAELQKKAWQALSIQRSQAGLEAFLAWLQPYHYRQLPPIYDREQLATANLCLVAEAIATAALQRKESLGAHSRKDEKIESITH